ncbi:hypothetical protein FQN53_001326 [Emmonsiellopsis sp. PD_33]|nr:hypothetical protein FQN53_001326 [Emmonsiellopsis sp. PD_33]
MSSRPKHSGRPPPKNQNPNPKPRPTHFLCLPLINPTSTPQLVSSLTEFKHSIPLVPPPVPAHIAASAQLPHQPLFPSSAIRPPGTLHLTLGVMHLPTQERLEEALGFLSGLDLRGMLREAELQTRRTEGYSDQLVNEDADADEDTDDAPPVPLSISLKGLHALPKARQASILHAQPVDETGRLYPFCVRVRQRFIEVGLMECETVRAPRSGNQGGVSMGSRVRDDNNDDDDENININTANNGGGNISQPQFPTSKPERGAGVPRPLLLHATIANTVYLPRRKQRGGGRKETLKFDARELLASFNGSEYTATSAELSGSGSEGEEQDGKQKREQVQSQTRDPFVWAKDIPIDRICICEMGAKPVEDDGRKGGSVLGEAYLSVGERRLVFGGGGEVEGEQESGEGDGGEDGGVRVV